MQTRAWTGCVAVSVLIVTTTGCGSSGSDLSPAPGTPPPPPGPGATAASNGAPPPSNLWGEAPAADPTSSGAAGRLAPIVIQTIVRTNFTTLRGCYEEGLRRKATLAGRVMTKFVIARDGSVSDVKDDGSDLPDPTVVKCVLAGFQAMRFPAPEGGIVTVVYPIMFSPATDPKP